MGLTGHIRPAPAAEPSDHRTPSMPLRAIRAVTLGAGAAAVLAYLPGNVVKLIALLTLCTVGLWPLRKVDIAVFVGINVLFAIMNLGALRQGVFEFTQPDVLGLPWWELVTWGFYVLLTVRTLDGEAPRPSSRVIVLALLFALPFAVITDPFRLLLAASAVVVVALALFRDPRDFAYAAFMLGLGAVIEYAGVWSGQWQYPGNPPGGVPLWFIPMWSGVGLFVRRLILPLAMLGAPPGPRARPSSVN